MRTVRPWRSMYSAMVVKPSGYISKMGVDGTMSETGPNMIERSRKSYTLGACSKHEVDARHVLVVPFGPVLTFRTP